MEETAETSLLERLGGEDIVGRWVDLFYDAVVGDPVLAPLFPEDLAESRAKQAAFFVQFLGGPPRYNERYGQPFMRYRHRHVRIGQPERDAWMRRVAETLEEVAGKTPVTEEIIGHLGKFADHMMNHHPERKDAEYFN